MITADTITDEQIRELRDDRPWSEQVIVFNNKRMTIADVAARALRLAGLARRAARGRCASILNARANGATP